jgi:hypothetical protein
MPRSAALHRTDRLIGRILAVLILLLVFIIPVIAITLVQTTGTPRVIQTTTPVPTPVATVQTVHTTITPQPTMTTVKMTTVATPVPTATMVPVSTIKTVQQTYTPVMTGSPVIMETTPRPTGTAVGTPRITGIVSGPAGTPQVMKTSTSVGGATGTQPTFSGTGQQAIAAGAGTPGSLMGSSLQFEAGIISTFNTSRLHQASLQGAELTEVSSAPSSGTGTGSVAGGIASYDADVTAARKGDVSNNCPDDIISIHLRNMSPDSPVAGRVVVGGSQLMFSDPSIQTVEIRDGILKIASLRHAKLFGIVDLKYTEVSTISPDSPVRTDKPFWLAVASEQPRSIAAEDNPCAEQALGQQNAGMTPGVTPTPKPEYQANEVAIICPCGPVCEPEAYQYCHNACLSQFPGENALSQTDEYCRDVCYEFDYNCCINSCMHAGGGDPAQLSADQFAFKEQDCRAECQYKWALSILKEMYERQSSNVAQMTRV